MIVGNRTKAPRTKAPLGQKPPDKKLPNILMFFCYTFFYIDSDIRYIKL